jgi:hypothetical protein
MTGAGKLPEPTIWRVRVQDVRRRAGGLRWTLLASTDSVETRVWVDSTERGGILDIQSDGYYGWSGDESLDYEAGECVRRALAGRHVSQQLDSIDVGRWGRIQRPVDRRWSA